MTIRICENHFLNDQGNVQKPNPLAANCDFCQNKINTSQLPLKDQIGFWMRRNVNWISLGLSPLPTVLFLYLGPSESEVGATPLLGSVLLLGVAASVLLPRLINIISVSISENKYVPA